MAKRFKCPKCKRVFSMPAHLARHLNTIHASKQTKAAAKKKRAKKRGRAKLARKQVRGAKAAPTLSRVTARVLKDMRSCHAELAGQHAALEAKLVAVQRAIEALETSGWR